MNDHPLKKTLVIVLGPTAVGKTKVAIELALALKAEIISADSRQFYKDLKIGTAAPNEEELALVKHHFIGHLDIEADYNVSVYEKEVLHFLNHYFLSHDVGVMAGGSGLYIDAVCRGIDDLPDPDDLLRQLLKQELEEKGLHALQKKLRQVDPKYAAVVDLNNPNRILRALEVCITTGKTYTSQRRNVPKQRNFNTIKIGLDRPREELVGRIHKRVDSMLEAGLLEEVKSLLPFKDLNALNTVGYKELYHFLSGKWSLELAVEKIKTNTRRYAKRQLTWFRRDPQVHWFHPNDHNEMVKYIRQQMK